MTGQSWDGRIADHHRKMLEASGITAAQASARGYRSITDRNRAILAEIGIVKAVQKSDGLLIPLLRIDGEVGGYQFRPDNPRVNKKGKVIKYETPWRQPNVIDFPPGVAERLADRSTPVWMTEGVKKVDSGFCAGLAIVGLTGVWNWLSSGAALPDFRDLALKDREVILGFDSDFAVKPEVWRAVRDLGEWLKVSRSAEVRYCILPHNGDGKTGLDDYLADDHTVEVLWGCVRPELPPLVDNKSSQQQEQLPIITVTMSLDQAHKVFERWLGADYDKDALNATLAAAAVERLTGDPVWLLVISGSGNAKTETVQAVTGAGALMTSTISSEGALLSATAKRDRDEDATGGLLRRLGDRGILVIKDFTSILSADRKLRGQILADLRDVYDGRWDREIGTGGGHVLTWIGRIVVIGAVTTKWDTAHDVIAAMGDRFVLVRMDSSDKTTRRAAGKKAIGNTRQEKQMRAELAEAAGGVINGIRTDVEPANDDEVDLLLAAADLVTLARTAVEYDYQGRVIDAHAPEMPTRFAKQLAQIVYGGVAIGLGRMQAMRLAIRCARDSMPPLRLAIIDDLANPDHKESSVDEVRRRINKPWSTVDRQLEALYMLDVLAMEETNE